MAGGSVRQGVSAAPRHPRDTLGTLFGHSGARGPGDTSSDTPRTPPVLGDTLADTLGTLGARRARETFLAGRGGSQLENLMYRDMGYRSEGIAISGDTGPLRISLVLGVAYQPGLKR